MLRPITRCWQGFAASDDGFRANHAEPVKVRLKYVRNLNRSVFLLVVLNYREPRPSNCKTRTVQSMGEPHFASVGRTIPNIRPACLEITEIAAGRNLAVLVLAGQPNFYVVGLGCAKTHVAGGQDDNAVWNLQPLQDFFSVPDKRLQFLAGLLLPGELYQFDLVELVLAKHTPNIFSMGTRFAAKAGRIRRKFYREAAAVENIFTIDVGQRDFRCGNKIEVGIPDLEVILFELWQLSRTEQTLRVCHEWRHDFGVAVLLRMDVEHEIDQCSLEPRPRA